MSHQCLKPVAALLLFSSVFQSSSDHCKSYINKQGNQIYEKPGFCIGIFVKAQSAETFADCAAACQDVEQCLWFTHFVQTVYCVMHASCNQMDHSCNDCFSGRVDRFETTPTLGTTAASAPNVPHEKIFVVGGRDAAWTKVEVIDMTGQYNCSQPSDLPVGLSGSCGVYIDGRVLICGGQMKNGTIVDSCYVYNAISNLWIPQTFRLLNVRANAACIKINDDTWWITGGLNADNFYSTTEYFHAHNNSFTPGPVLPSSLCYHCVTQIDATRFMVVGGASVATLTTAAIYNYTNNQWDIKTPLPSGRYGHFCGTVVSRNSITEPWVIEVVAAGGSQHNTHVYSVSTNTWRVGAVHPLDTAFGSSISMDQSFLTIGGDSGDLSIYNYNVTNSGTWVDMNLKLRFPRVESAAFTVPNNFFSCGEETL